MVWNSSSGEIVTKFSLDPGSEIECCCFSPNGTLIAIASGRTIYIWDTTGSDPQLIETFIGHTNIIVSVVFSSPSSLISAAGDLLVKFWQITFPSADQVTTHPKTGTTIPISASTRSITLQAENNTTISSDSDGVVKIWDLSTCICKASFQTPAKDAKSDVQLIDNRLILIWHVDGEIHIYDVEKEKLLHIVDAPKYIIDIRISGDGSKILCLTGEDIQAWSIWTGEAWVRHIIVLSI